MLRIRRLQDCLIFNMGIPIPVRRHLCIDTPPLVAIVGTTGLVPSHDIKSLQLILRSDTVDFGGLVQERFNSSALAMELRLSCTDLSISSTGVWSYNEVQWFELKVRPLKDNIIMDGWIAMGVMYPVFGIWILDYMNAKYPKSIMSCCLFFSRYGCWLIQTWTKDGCHFADNSQ